MEVQDFERKIKEQEYGREFAFSAAFPALMRKVYLWMTFALAISGMVAYGVATSPNLLRVIYTNKLVFWGIMGTNNKEASRNIILGLKDMSFPRLL